MVGIRLAREEGAPLLSRTAVINNVIDNQGAWVPSVQILPTNFYV